MIVENCHFKSGDDYLLISGSWLSKNKYKIDRLQSAYKDNYLVNSGIYVFKSSICQLIKKNNEYDMDVFIKKIIKKKMKIKVLPIPENKFHDIGTLDNFIKTKKNLKI